jgi:hypothetical protein
LSFELSTNRTLSTNSFVPSCLTDLGVFSFDFRIWLAGLAFLERQQWTDVVCAGMPSSFLGPLFGSRFHRRFVRKHKEDLDVEASFPVRLDDVREPLLGRQIYSLQSAGTHMAV